MKWDIFFPDEGIKACLLSAKNAADFTGTGPVRAEGVREVWDTVTDGVSLLTYVLTTCSVNAERRRRRRELCLPERIKVMKIFPRLTQGAVNLLQTRKLLKLTGL